MNKFLKVMFILLIIAMTGAMISIFLSRGDGFTLGIRSCSRLAKGNRILESSCPNDFDCCKCEV